MFPYFIHKSMRFYIQPTIFEIDLNENYVREFLAYWIFTKIKGKW